MINEIIWICPCCFGVYRIVNKNGGPARALQWCDHNSDDVLSDSDWPTVRIHLDE